MRTLLQIQIYIIFKILLYYNVVNYHNGFVSLSNHFIISLILFADLELVTNTLLFLFKFNAYILALEIPLFTDSATLSIFEHRSLLWTQTAIGIFLNNSVVSNLRISLRAVSIFYDYSVASNTNNMPCVPS